MARVIVWQFGRRRLEVQDLGGGARAAVLLDGETFAGCWALPPRLSRVSKPAPHELPQASRAAAAQPSKIWPTSSPIGTQRPALAQSILQR